MFGVFVLLLTDRASIDGAMMVRRRAFHPSNRQDETNKKNYDQKVSKSVVLRDETRATTNSSDQKHTSTPRSPCFFPSCARVSD